MASVTGSKRLQIGDWNAPQIISLDSLFDKYTIENTFLPKEATQMATILTRWKELVKDHYSIPTRDRPFIASYISKNSKFTRRTAHDQFPEAPHIIFKSYMPNSSELHPMAKTLRVPMASILAETITKEELNGIGVPRKALFPLFSKEVISTLNEKDINEAFIVCAEKMDVLSSKETIKRVKAMSAEDQERLADQICTLLMKTGLGDCTWENIQMHRDNGKLYILDTETLQYELFIDKFDKGFEKCASAVDDMSLKEAVKFSLNLFAISSNLHELDVFEKKARAYLGKISKRLGPYSFHTRSDG